MSERPSPEGFHPTPERQEHEPKIEVDFFLTPHETAKDLKGIEPHIKRADIIMLEGSGWSPPQIKLLNAIARGEVDPDRVIDFERQFMAHDPSQGGEPPTLDDDIAQAVSGPYPKDFRFRKTPRKVEEAIVQRTSDTPVESLSPPASAHNAANKFAEFTFDNYSPFLRELMRKIAGSDKPITVLDVPEGRLANEQNKAFVEMMAGLLKAQLAFGRGEPEVARETLQQRYNLFYQHFIEHREQYIRELFRKKMKSLLNPNDHHYSEEFAHLGRQDVIRPLVIFGAAHTKLPLDLRSDTVTTRRNFNQPTFTFSINHEILRRKMFGKEISDEVYDQAIIENMINMVMRERFKGTLVAMADYYPILRRLASQWTEQEIVAASRLMAEQKGRDDKLHAFIAFSEKIDHKIPLDKASLEQVMKSRVV